PRVRNPRLQPGALHDRRRRPADLHRRRDRRRRRLQLRDLGAGSGMRPGGHRQAAGLARGQILSDGAERNGSPLAIIFFTVFIDLVGFGIVLPLLPYYAESLGASSFQVGLLSTSYSLMQFLFTPVWGRLSDRYGRRPLILLSLAGSCLGFLVFGLAHDLLLLFAARMVAGVAGAIIPTTYAYIADVTGPEDRARRMGLVGAAFGLG